jgi:DNA-binding MarR family transcriptional regulator
LDPLRKQLTDPQLEPLLDVINLIRLLDREMPAQVVATFLYVATHDNCHKQALEEALDFTAASGSRNTDWLSSKHRLGKPGLNLITKQSDPTNRRRQTLSLTPKGRMLAKQLKETLYGN